MVAIIGILAAVGIVAYSGYTASAKHNVTVANHTALIKILINDSAMCDIGGIPDRMEWPNCNIKVYTQCGLSFDNILDNHFFCAGFKNPYGNNLYQNKGVHWGSGNLVGQTYMVGISSKAGELAKLQVTTNLADGTILQEIVRHDYWARGK